MGIRLIILGLRRSGTTIFWETLRQDRRFVGYDEPFNSLLQVLPGERVAQIKHPEEFQALVERDKVEFWSRFAPIDKSDELCQGLSDRQLEYLDYLGATGEAVMLDSTRCHFKVAALRRAAPEALLLHLYRPPQAHACSHMLPTSTNKMRTRARRYLNTRDFWTRPDRYDYWQFESIIGGSDRSLFAERLREAGMDPQSIYEMPAVAKLMAYWRVNFERVERDGRQEFGENFISLKFDAFCSEPESALESIYAKLDMELPELKLDRIHPAKGPFDADSPNWARFAELLELPAV
ncbi:MAG: hypothetical protein GY716_05785 [bacterium]|nr:hypothetical protein [bacterium]